MKEVTIQYAKSNLARLLERVEAGEEIVIVRDGVAVARLTSPVRRQLGIFCDRIWLADDFDSPLPRRILDSFEGKSPKGKRKARNM